MIRPQEFYAKCQSKPHAQLIVAKINNISAQRFNLASPCELGELDQRIDTKHRNGDSKAKIAIANRLARAIYKILSGDKYKERGYKKGDPREIRVRRLVEQLRAEGVNIFHVDHQMIVSENRIVVEKTGIVLSPQQ